MQRFLFLPRILALAFVNRFGVLSLPEAGDVGHETRILMNHILFPLVASEGFGLELLQVYRAVQSFSQRNREPHVRKPEQPYPQQCMRYLQCQTPTPASEILKALKF